VSKLLGANAVDVMSGRQIEASKQWAQMGFIGTVQNYNEARCPLLTRGEMLTLHEVVQLVIPANANPVICRKHRWFEDQPWSGRGKPPPSIFKPLLPAPAGIAAHGRVDYPAGVST
jgi:type IV secretory pathway TraG/TraD family ATPase VirD4